MSDNRTVIASMETVPPEVFRLTPAEQMSPLWRKLEDHLNRRLVDLRKQNDNEKLDAISTASLRGQIRTLKGLIALGATSPVIPADG